MKPSEINRFQINQHRSTFFVGFLFRFNFHHGTDNRFLSNAAFGMHRDLKGMEKESFGVESLYRFVKNQLKVVWIGIEIELDRE
jgi:hypothetical protein